MFFNLLSQDGGSPALCRVANKSFSQDRTVPSEAGSGARALALQVGADTRMHNTSA